jgi:hypothetical protein
MKHIPHHRPDREKAVRTKKSGTLLFINFLPRTLAVYLQNQDDGHSYHFCMLVYVVFFTNGNMLFRVAQLLFSFNISEICLLHLLSYGNEELQTAVMMHVVMCCFNAILLS